MHYYDHFVPHNVKELELRDPVYGEWLVCAGSRANDYNQMRCERGNSRWIGNITRFESFLFLTFFIIIILLVLIYFYFLVCSAYSI